MGFKTTFTFIAGLSVGVAATCASGYYYSKSFQKKLAVVATNLDQSVAFSLAESLPNNLSKRAPIVMSALWKNAAIGSSAKNLYPNLLEDFDHISHEDTHLIDEPEEILPERDRDMIELLDIEQTEKENVESGNDKGVSEELTEPTMGTESLPGDEDAGSDK